MLSQQSTYSSDIFEDSEISKCLWTSRLITAIIEK
ncbi:unnamed protein product [Arabidopsis thaliana]|uniref:(thale cress) hypothetical protein n=1 Tax=Arabidopsis thaliana TaxID=3702 RepID=A0A7G2EVE6_ARATH|nr:unnamed protein product [Arabidopsis thaliana]